MRTGSISSWSDPTLVCYIPPPQSLSWSCSWLKRRYFRNFHCGIISLRISPICKHSQQFKYLWDCVELLSEGRAGLRNFPKSLAVLGWSWMCFIFLCGKVYVLRRVTLACPAETQCLEELSEPWIPWRLWHQGSQDRGGTSTSLPRRLGFFN